jgi:DNA-binding winged helix-turn-helix (wHTH) protein
VIYTFESFELDEESFALRRAGEVVKLEPKVFDVLRHLVASKNRDHSGLPRRGRTVTD